MESRPPFIGCFHTNSHRYVYDVNTGSILRVPEDTYKILSDLAERKLPLDPARNDSQARDPVIEALLSRGHLSSKRPHGVSPILDLDTVSRLLKDQIQQCTLEMTQDCNQACRYCSYIPENQGRRNPSSKTMSWETARTAIDYFLDHSVRTDGPALSFYGGEPLLAWEMMKKCITYAKARKGADNLTINYSTNGTLITDSIAAFCAKHEVRVLVSLDGPRCVHDAHRIFKQGEADTYDAVLKGLRILQKQYKARYADWVSLNAVYGPLTDLEEVILYFQKQGPDQVRTLPVKLSGRSQIYGAKNHSERIDEKALSAGKQSYDRIEEKWFRSLTVRAEEGSESNSIIQDLFQDPFRRLHQDLNKKLPDLLPPKGMCIPGVRKIFVDVDGRILPCERVSETDSIVIGRIDNGGVDPEKSLALLDRITRFFTKRCPDCIFCRICSGCLSQFTDTSGDLSEPAMNAFCETMYAECRQTLLNFTLALEKNPACFDHLERIPGLGN